MNRKWRCVKCSSLLGQEQESHLHIRYREDVQILVEGRDYRLMRACRKCGTLNMWRVEVVNPAQQ